MKSMLKFLLVMMYLAAASCQIEPNLLKDADASEGIGMQLTAQYTLNKADILLLQDNSGEFADTSWRMSRAIYNGNNQTLAAIQDFSTRLYFSGIDYQVGIMDTNYSNEVDVTNRAGNLVSFSAELGFMLDGKQPDFVNVFKQKADLDGASGRNRRGDQRFIRPLTALKNMLEKSTDVANPENLFLRPGAFLNIIYVGFRDEVNETVTVEEAIEALNSSRGVGNWRVSVVTSPADGCVLPRTPAGDGTSRDRHTHSITANSTDEAVYSLYERQNLMMRLQEYSQGMFESICADNFEGFFKRVAKEGSDNAFFTKLLDAPANPITLKVLVNDSEVEGWKYDERAKLLYIPTSIPNGQKFSITYRTTNTPGKGVFQHKVRVEELDDISGRVLTPEELVYINDVAPILAVCRGCHGGNNPPLRTFADVRDASADVVRVINLPDTDPLFMPRNGTPISAADIQTIQDWADSL